MLCAVHLLRAAATAAPRPRPLGRVLSTVRPSDARAARAVSSASGSAGASAGALLRRPLPRALHHRQPVAPVRRQQQQRRWAWSGQPSQERSLPVAAIASWAIAMLVVLPAQRSLQRQAYLETGDHTDLHRSLYARTLPFSLPGLPGPAYVASELGMMVSLLSFTMFSRRPARFQQWLAVGVVANVLDAYLRRHFEAKIAVDGSYVRRGDPQAANGIIDELSPLSPGSTRQTPGTRFKTLARALRHRVIEGGQGNGEGHEDDERRVVFGGTPRARPVAPAPSSSSTVPRGSAPLGTATSTTDYVFELPNIFWVVEAEALPALKKQLRARSLPVHGTRAQLVRRLYEAQGLLEAPEVPVEEATYVQLRGFEGDTPAPFMGSSAPGAAMGAETAPRAGKLVQGHEVPEEWPMHRLNGWKATKIGRLDDAHAKLIWASSGDTPEPVKVLDSAGFNLHDPFLVRVQFRVKTGQVFSATIVVRRKNLLAAAVPTPAAPVGRPSTSRAPAPFA